MSWFRLWLRFAHIAFVCAGAFLVYGFRRLFAGRLSEERRQRLIGESLASLLERLGATFIKFGQILSTRPDLLPPGVIEPLARLQDQVPPASFATIERASWRNGRTSSTRKSESWIPHRLRPPPWHKCTARCCKTEPS